MLFVLFPCFIIPLIFIIIILPLLLPPLLFFFVQYFSILLLLGIESTEKDLILSFRTGYFEEGELEMDPAIIRSNYLRSWFVVDFLSAIPVDMISTEKSRSMSLLKLVKLLRLLRLLRMFRLNRIFRFDNLVALSLNAERRRNHIPPLLFP